MPICFLHPSPLPRPGGHSRGGLGMPPSVTSLFVYHTPFQQAVRCRSAPTRSGIKLSGGFRIEPSYRPFRPDTLPAGWKASHLPLFSNDVAFGLAWSLVDSDTAKAQQFLGVAS